MNLPFSPTRSQLLAAAVAAAVVVVSGIGAGLVAYQSTQLHASLAVANAGHVRILDPVVVRFDQPIDAARAQVRVEPSARFTIKHLSDRLVITPTEQWQPAASYTVVVGNVSNAKHTTTLRSWQAAFVTQPKVGVAGFQIDGKTVDKSAFFHIKSKLTVAFTAPMLSSSVTVDFNGQPLPASALAWAPDGTTVVVSPPALAPYQPFTLGVPASGTSAQGDELTDGGQVSLTASALLPSNSSSGVGGDFKTVPPLEIVIENSGAAKPQTGFQRADIVYEYISEYSITRMTAIYFNQAPDLIGPVRSCRMINPYLGYSFGGETMCSGASVGTLHYMFFDPYLVPGSINDFDRGNHFYRVGFKAAPHNVYTDGGRAARLRDEWHLPNPDYQVDPPHDDIEAGAPADAPGVPLHGASYSYDTGSRQYLRSDHGSLFMDDGTKSPVSVKNVVLMHVGFHDAGWIEDEAGGAHSIWYDMLGSGPAEIYSDGKLVHAAWHMGSGGTQPFYDNKQPVYFTDDGGHVIELNTGLTWIHVLGNGQTS